MMSYLIKSGLCLSILVLFYYVFLEKEKMHQFNRFYLLATILFAVIIPLFTITVQPISTAINNQEQLYINFTTVNEAQNNNFDWLIVVYTSYALISLILAVRFVKNLLTILKKARCSQKIKENNIYLVLIEENILPFTFLHYVFVNKYQYNNCKIPKELITHEIAHATQKHSIDIIIIEAIQIFFWINPIIYFLKKAIKLNHEFLADNCVISTYKNTTKYQHLLLETISSSQKYYLASNFNYLLTKKRFIMMHKKSKQQWLWLKKTAVLPLIATLIFVFAERVTANPVIIDSSLKQNENTTNDINATKDIKNKIKKVNRLKMEYDTVAKPKKIMVYRDKKDPKKSYVSYTDENDATIVKKMSKLSKKEIFELPPPPPKSKERANNSSLKSKETQKTGKVIHKRQTPTLNVTTNQKKTKVYNNNNITDELKNDIIYYVNGKRKKHEVVKSIPPSNVKEIKVVKNEKENAIYITLK